MPAYLVVEHIITDAAKFEEYRVKVGPMIARHGGRYLTKGGSHKMPEGGHWNPERVVIIEFPDMASLNAWYTSPEYQPLIALRKSCTSELDMMFTLEGGGASDAVDAVIGRIALRCSIKNRMVGWVRWGESL